MEHKLSGIDILLFIDRSGGTAYEPVVCLTTNSWKGSNSIIDASTKCGPDSLPGVPTPYLINFEGQHLFDAQGIKISGVGLFPLLTGQTKIGWKIAPVSPVEGDEIFTGTGFISELGSTYAQNSPATFTGAISIYGLPTQSIEGS